jgi:ABC-type multidrug transport system fused ATPase/permease subunit
MRSRFNIQHILELTRALRLVWQSGSGWTIASVVLLVVQGTLPLLSLYFMKLIIDAITIGLAATTQKVAFFQVAFLIDFAGTVALVGALCHSIARLVNEAQAQVVTELPTTYTSFCMLSPLRSIRSIMRIHSITIRFTAPKNKPPSDPSPL